MNSDNFRLSFFGLPIIQTLDDFSNVTHVSQFTIYQLSNYSEKNYFVYTIPKKNGKLRTISQPSKQLKGLQAWILHNILYKLKVSSSCKGFEKGSSTKDNAEPHKYCNAILNVDIKDFFPSINRNQVYNIFKIIGYNKLISTILTNLCTFNDSLPQGSPCSPRLANLIAWKLDVRIQNYVGRRGITYTRYADDLSISGLSPIKVINTYPMLKIIVEDEGFKINFTKTRMSGNARAKKVTGLTISDDNTGVGQKIAKNIRSKIFHLTKIQQNTNTKLLNEVRGWLSYLNSVDKKRLASLNKYITNLKSNYPQTLVQKLP